MTKVYLLYFFKVDEVSTMLFTGYRHNETTVPVSAIDW